MKLFSLTVLCLLLGAVTVSNAGYNAACDWIDTHITIWTVTGHMPLVYFLRAEALLDMAMFEATAAYTHSFTPLTGRTNMPLRPGTQRTDAFRTKAIDFAAYRIIQQLYAGREQEIELFAGSYMSAKGYDTSYTGEDLTRADGVGNRAARLIIELRRTDRSNQYADMPGTKIGGRPYSDFTNYHPVNNPQGTAGKTSCSELRDINHWQPLNASVAPGVYVIQDYAATGGASAGYMEGFAVTSGMDFAPPGPPLYGTNTHDEFMRQVREVINISSSLNDEKKLAAEYYGFRQYSTYATQLAQERRMNLAETVGFILLHGLVELDGAVVGWAVKRHFDSYRPVSVIQCLYSGQFLKAWSGPYQGVKTIQAEDWTPYTLYDLVSPAFRTPDFPEYVSGHAISGGAVMSVYKLYFGSDQWGASVTLPGRDHMPVALETIDHELE